MWMVKSERASRDPRLATRKCEVGRTATQGGAPVENTGVASNMGSSGRGANGTTAIPNILQRFWSYVDKSENCWLWTGSTSPQGYGQFKYCGKVLQAHRFAYWIDHGMMPMDLQMDHLCRTRSCVRATHLEPVSVRENIRRGLIGILRTQCRNGHPHNDENTSTITRKSGRTHRYCLVCNRAEWRHRQR